MKNCVFNKVLVFNMALLSAVALTCEVKAYDAGSESSAYNVRTVDGAPEDIGVGESVSLQTIATDSTGAQTRAYKGASGSVYIVNLGSDGSYSIIKNGAVIQEGKNSQASSQPATAGANVQTATQASTLPTATATSSGASAQTATQAPAVAIADIAGGESSAGTMFGASGKYSDGSSEGSSAAEREMTITTTTNNNGEVSTQTSTSGVAVQAGGATSGADATSAAATGQASADAKEAEKKAEDAEKKDEKQKEEDLSQYTGLYNGRHLIPDAMAVHCRIKGEEVAQDPKKFVKCIKQYVSEMNNPNATAKAEAEKEYELLKYKVLTDAGSTAITKGAATNNHEDALNDANETQFDGSLASESDDNKGIMYSLSLVTNMMNDIRELLVQQLKYDVISGIGDIDPAIIMEDEELKEEVKKDEKVASGGEAKGPNYQASSTKVEIKNK